MSRYVVDGFTPFESPFTVFAGSQVRDNYPDLLARTHYPMLKKDVTLVWNGWALIPRWWSTPFRQAGVWQR